MTALRLKWTQMNRAQCTSNARESEHGSDKNVWVWNAWVSTMSKTEHPERNYIRQHLLLWSIHNDEIKGKLWFEIIWKWSPRNMGYSEKQRNKSQFWGVASNVFLWEFPEFVSVQVLKNGPQSSLLQFIRQLLNSDSSTLHICRLP